MSGSGKNCQEYYKAVAAMNTGLYFGSYNPVHIGHLAIANWLIEFTDLDEIWFVVSPHNPLKKKSTLLADHHRLELVELAIGDDHRFRVSGIESRLPQPSYTIDTITYLREKHPGKKFSLIMGSDNLTTLYKWKNINELIRTCTIYAYPRKEVKRGAIPDLDDILAKADIRHVDAPLIEISGTFIRNAIKEGKDIRHLLAPQVWKHICNMNFYRV